MEKQNHLHDDPPEDYWHILRPAEVRAMCGDISDPTLRRWERSGRMPTRFKLDGESTGCHGASGFYKGEVLAALKAMRERQA